MLMIRGIMLTMTLAVGGIAAADATVQDKGTRTPQLNYVLHCQGCHLPDGSGKTGLVPDMRRELPRFARAPAGRNYIAQVPGVATSRLNDAEVAELLNWLVVKMDSSAAMPFTPYTAVEIAGLRVHWLQNPKQVRAALVSHLEDKVPHDGGTP